MTNFLQETLKEIAATGHNYEGAIKFIGSADGRYGCTFEQFLKLADFNYDSGYGSAEIPDDLVILFDDGTYMTRGEYDGSEWWNFNAAPKVPETYQQIINLDQRRSKHIYPSFTELQELADSL